MKKADNIRILKLIIKEAKQELGFWNYLSDQDAKIYEFKDDSMIEKCMDLYHTEELYNAYSIYCSFPNHKM